MHLFSAIQLNIVKAPALFNKSLHGAIEKHTRHRELDPSHSLCLFSPAVGNFFGYSCVPGVKDPQHDPRGNNPKNLCEACIGDDNDRHICANSHRERHYGEAGALRSVREAAVRLTEGPALHKIPGAASAAGTWSQVPHAVIYV